MRVNKHGIRIDTTPKISKRTPLNMKLELIKMIQNDRKVKIPKISPVLKFLQGNGYRKERTK